jgi:hypothetical protein
MSAAMEQLRGMITSDMMKPIMALQGSSLGFRTDKDKEGGYKEDVVKEVLIEATLKGFRMVNNESNVIAGRFYAARDGFERIFRDLGKTGRVTDLKLTAGVPRTQADGAIVDYAASWTFRNTKGDAIKDEMKLAIPVKVNAGQGPDAILGKAKRKILAAIYSRITGTEITDGDVDDPKGMIDVTSRPADAPVDTIKADTLELLEKLLKPHEETANKYLVGIQAIKEGQTFRSVTDKFGRTVLAKSANFLNAAGIKSSG